MNRHFFAALALVASSGNALAQTRPVTFYYQNVPLWSGHTPIVDGGLSDFNRFRVMSDPSFGDFSFRIAYEQVATFRESDSRGLFIGGVPTGGEWLDLQWTLVDEEHVLWQHRLDRLEVSWSPTTAFELTAGRQVVSWATTLFLTPTDPFSPFSPADPFRVFRAGVDAVRARVYPGPLSELDLVLRPTKNDGVGEELTIVGRGLTTWHNWEISGWGGSLYGDVAGAFGASGSVGSSALRGEAVIREVDGEVVFRGTIGFDHQFTVSKRDLYVVLEYQHDGLAASSPSEYSELLQSGTFLRGELQVFGRNEAVAQASFQVHPLWSLAALGLWNLNDGSFLLSPSFSRSLSNEASVTGGAFFGFGDDIATVLEPWPSEYGSVAATVYLSFSLFF